MHLDGFETRLLTGDVAALASFYRALGFTDRPSAEGGLRLGRGDCRLILAQSTDGVARTELVFGRGDGEASRRDVGGAATAEGVRLTDPDGMGLIVGRGDGASGARTAVAFDPTLGWYELSLDVADIGRTAAFYGRLGFEGVEGSLAQRRLTLEQGDSRLCLYQGYLDPAGTQLIFWQGDVAAIAALAERQGLKIWRGLLGNDEGHLTIMLQDPDDRGVFFIFIPGVERRTLAEG